LLERFIGISHYQGEKRGEAEERGSIKLRKREANRDEEMENSQYTRQERKKKKKGGEIKYKSEKRNSRKGIITISPCEWASEIESRTREPLLKNKHG